MSPGHLRSVLLGPMHVQRDQVKIAKPTVTALLVGVAVLASILADQIPVALPIAIGIIFVGLANFGASGGEQVRSMSWSLVWISTASFLAGIVASLGLAQVPFAMAIALLAGFAGALGNRGAFVGVLALVVYTIFSAAPETERTALTTTLLIAAGGLIQLMVGGVIIVIQMRRHKPAPSVNEAKESVLILLQKHRNRDDQFARHAIRLSIAIGVATALGQSLGWPHEYWIPMTVAWVSRPDRQGTSTRVLGRTIGTLAGVAAAVIAINYVGSGDYRLALFAAIGSFVALAYIAANYSIAVVGITFVLISLMTLDGDAIDSTAVYRIACTLVAAVITIGASFILPAKETKT